MSSLSTHTAQKPRISVKIRTAIEARVRQGLGVAAAAEAAGMSRNGFAKALKRPAVQEHLWKMQAAFVAEIEASRAVYKAQALEAALDLMKNAQSETVRARMIEFLAGDVKSPKIAVRVDARPQRSYEFVQSNQRVVEIESKQTTSSPSAFNNSDGHD